MKFTYKYEGNNFISENNSKNMLFSMIWSLGIVFISLANILIILVNERGLHLFIIVIFIALGIYGLRIFLWQVYGKEILIVNEKTLSLEKKGTILTKKRIYKLDNIKIFPNKKNKVEKTFIEEGIRFRKILFKTMTRISFGEICFFDNYKKVSFFNDLNEEEKDLIIEEILKRKK